MSNLYFDKLVNEVISFSESQNFHDAVLEWEIVDCEEDETNSSRCICGKENLRYLFTIRNVINNNILFPIGSSCIKKFNRIDLNELTSVKESLFKLYHAIENKEFLTLSSDLFTRKLLLHLFNEGAFHYNNLSYDAEQSYEFMLKMFNKRNKEDITEKQNRKIIAILLNNIKPFIENQLAGKIK